MKWYEPPPRHALQEIPGGWDFGELTTLFETMTGEPTMSDKPPADDQAAAAAARIRITPPADIRAADLMALLADRPADEFTDVRVGDHVAVLKKLPPAGKLLARAESDRRHDHDDDDAPELDVIKFRYDGTLGALRGEAIGRFSQMCRAATNLLKLHTARLQQRSDR